MSGTTNRWTWEYHPDRPGDRIALSARDRDVILAMGDGERSWLEVSDEDARMIEAVPELLAALREVVAISDRKHDAWDRAKAAIARATVEPLP